MGRFHTVFEGPLEEKLDGINTASAFKVFFKLPKLLTWTEFRQLNQVALAAELHIDDASVSRALRDLLNRGIIERQGRGPASTWKLSIDWGWRGNVETFHHYKAHGVLPGRAKNANAAEDILC
jgi:hypothetical protein